MYNISTDINVIIVMLNFVNCVAADLLDIAGNIYEEI
jgi:hypothetical protein